MNIIMYGAEDCPDCAAAKAELKAVAAELDFRDITKSLRTLKEFLAYRDNDEMFLSVIKAGGIGIPLFILENQTRTLDIKDFLHTEKTRQAESSCTSNGEGC